MFIWYSSFSLLNKVRYRNLEFSFVKIQYVIALQVCAAERANIQSRLLERFVGYCQGDIRKTIMHLQFWCQGRTTRKGQSNSMDAFCYYMY